MELTFIDEGVWRSAVRDFSKLCKVSSWKSEYVDVTRYSVFTGSYGEFMKLLDLCDGEAANRLRRGVEILIMAIKEGVIDELEGKDDFEIVSTLIDRLGLDNMKLSLEDVENMLEFQLNKLFVFTPLMEAIRRLIGKEDKMSMFLENVYIDISLLLVDAMENADGEEIEKYLDKVLDIDHVWVYPVYKLSFDLWYIDEEVEELLDKYSEHVFEDVDEIKSGLAAKESILLKTLEVLEESCDFDNRVGEEVLVDETVKVVRNSTFTYREKVLRILANRDIVVEGINHLDGKILKRKGGYVKKVQK